MQIWLMKPDTNNFRHIQCINEEDSTFLNREICSGKSLTFDWKAILTDDDKKSRKKSDYPAGLLTPVVSAKVKKLFENKNVNNIEFLPLSHPTDEYFSLNITNVIDAVEPTLSIPRKRGEHIYGYNEIYLIENKVKNQDIFLTYIHGRNKVLPFKIFISDKVKKLIEESNLKGFSFIEVSFSEK